MRGGFLLLDKRKDKSDVDFSFSSGIILTSAWIKNKEGVNLNHFHSTRRQRFWDK